MALAGFYRSAFRGRGVDFDQVVKYVYGDDVRTIDWNVTARRGEPYRKKYIEERELSLHIFFEEGPGMFFGSGNRICRECALDFIALICYLCVLNRDCLSINHLTASSHTFYKPGRSRSSLFATAQKILNSPYRVISGQIEDTKLSQVLRTTVRLLPKHTIFFWLSDFPPRTIPEEWPILQQRFVCIGVRIDDPWYTATPRSGMFSAIDTSDGETLTLDWGNPKVRRQHTQWRHYREQIWKRLFPAAADRLTLQVGQPTFKQLYEFLLRRARLSQRCSLNI